MRFKNLNPVGRALGCLRKPLRARTRRPATDRNPLRPFFVGALIIACLIQFPGSAHAFLRVKLGTYDGRNLGQPSPLNSIPSDGGQGSQEGTNDGDDPSQNGNGDSDTGSNGVGDGGNGSGQTSSNDASQTAGPDVEPPAESDCPILYKYGAAYEKATDISLSAPGMNWSMTRSYVNGAAIMGGDTTQGSNWFNSACDKQLNMTSSTTIDVILDAATKRTFVLSGSTWTAPADGYSTLTYDSTNSQYIFADQIKNLRWTFHDWPGNNTKSEGGPKEDTTLQLFTQGKSGCAYTLATSGLPSQVTTPTGQNYTITFTYELNEYLQQVQVKDSSGNLLQQVNYTYYQDVTSPSTDLGSSGDLVQVQVAKKATTDTAGALTIVRNTQYRYSGTTHRLKAVYEHDAIQRLLASTGLSSPTAALSQADTYGTPAIKSFASRSFTYYTSDANTASVNTPFSAGENLQSRYGGSNLNETGYVATETIGGCGGCGASQSVTKNYFYMTLPNTATDQNQVVNLCVEDTQDSAGSAIYRQVFGLDGSGRTLRRAFIQSPIVSPTYWCDSWTFATATGTTALPFRLAEHRHPSAHTGVTTSTALQNFLNPYNGTSWSNDTSTVNSSSGLIETYSYNSTGLVTDAYVKNGESGTAYYVSAKDYGDSVNPTVVTATYDYPTQTTMRSSGNQTSYSYTFYDSSTHQQVQTKTTTLPSVPTGQNGSGVATTTGLYYDNMGRLRWKQDGEGYITYYSYHPSMGRLAYQAVDVNPSSVSSDISSGSTGNWDSWAVGGASSNAPTRGGSLPTALALATKGYFDSLGRRTQVTDTGGNSHYQTYANLQTVLFPFWSSSTSQSLLPIQVTNLNSGAQISDRIGVRASYTAISTSSGVPTGFSTVPSQSDYVSWKHYTYDANTGWLTYTDRYIDSPSSGFGTLSTDFYRTVAEYDTLGRQQYSIQVIRGSVHSDRVEQVTQYVYDVRNRITQVSKGVSGDTAANSQDMTDSYNVYPTLYTIGQAVYDSGAVGDDLVTKIRQFFGTSSTSYTGANVYRTYRGHVRGIEPFYLSGTTETPIGPYTVGDVDWKGRATTTAQYSADPSWSGVLTGDGYAAYAASTSTNRQTETSAAYDNLNRVYQTLQYDIAPSTGTGTTYLARNAFYDRDDRVVAAAPAYAAGTEIAYDGAGRAYQSRTVTALQSTPYASGTYQYCAPTPNPTLSSMTGGDAGVLELTHQTLDANGNVLETDAFEDNHDDVTGSTPGLNFTSNNDYVRRTVFSWYDTANRITTAADYGSGDTASGAGQWKYATIPSRPATAPTASTSTALATIYGYAGDSGLLQTLTDPAGTVTKNFYDNLARKTYVAENWNDFSPPSTGTGDSTDHSKDRVTNYVYDGPSRIQQLVAMDPNGTGTLTNNQVTTYLYEDPVDATRNTSQIYPDSSDTTSSGTNQIKLVYNVDGSLSTRTDQRGVVLSYAYTNNRLPAIQSATTIPTGVDSSIQSIAHTYDSLNRPLNITSYASTGGTGTVVNDIQYAYYNGTAKPLTAYQEHKGAVNTSTSLNVQYTYDTTTTGSIYSNQLRLQTEVHPNGRAIYYDYGSSSGSTAAYSANSTVRKIWDGSPSGTGLAVYDYNGAGKRLAMATYLQPSFNLDHFEGTSGTYGALDRFGRIVDQYWAGFSGTSDVDRTHYAYDYTDRQIFRQIDTTIYPTDNLDKAYSYDALRRLLTSQVGTLSGTTISGTPGSEEDWILDGLGNWTGYIQKTSGTTSLNQSRTANPANEISGISASVGSTWTTPAYDLAGNMTTIPIPSSPTSGYTATYDAWNRLVSLANGSSIVATYAYDGLSRRIVKGIYASGTLDHNEHAYLNESWQILEIRKEVSGSINANPLEQYVWHEFYIDAPLLRDYDATTSGAPTRYYYTFDGNFDVTAATTSAGSPAERYYYSPYGGLVYLNASFTPLTTQQSQIGNSLAFTGRQVDAESGLYYFRSRYYHAELGVFVSRDDETYVDGLSLYAAYFVPDDVDPTGLSARTCTQLRSGPASFGLASFLQQVSEGTKTLGGTWASVLGFPDYFPRGDDPRAEYRVTRKLSFTPNPDFNGDVNNIGFIQLMKATYTDGQNKGKDSEDRVPFHLRKIEGGWAVDRQYPAKSGWWGAVSHTGGSAFFTDRPRSFHRPVKWEFQVFAIARTNKQGKSNPRGDSGMVLSGIKWGFNVDGAGNVTTITGLERVTEFRTFERAINAWNKQADLRIGEGKNASGQIRFGNIKIDPIYK
jgi:RHS repeat-associated protein